MNKATWFKPEENLDIRRRRPSLDDLEPYARYILRFGLEYRFRLSHNLPDGEAIEQFDLEKQYGLWSMEDELMNWIIKQWYAVPTENIERFILVETPNIPKGKPVILLHPEDRNKLLDSLGAFVRRYDLFAVKPLKEALE
ncbi:MAG: hypothetical protein KAQ99_07355 [Candidatus Aureabacteria bacterium]|nr:hypothetical protein [Candidatus Auribacterota bacterium]